MLYRRVLAILFILRLVRRFPQFALEHHSFVSIYIEGRQKLLEFCFEDQ